MSVQEQQQERDKNQPIDREKQCPLLLRCFYKINGQYNVDDFSKQINGLPVYPQDELQIYTWPDATLREIYNTVEDSILNAGKDFGSGSCFFSLLYVDGRNGNHIIKKVSTLHTCVVY